MKKQTSFLLLVTTLTLLINVVLPSSNIKAQDYTDQLELNIPYKTAKLFPKRVMDEHDKINKFVQTSNYYLIEGLLQYWQNDEWVNSGKATYKYDEQGNRTEQHTQH